MPEIGGYSLFTLLAICLAGVGCLFHVIGLSVVYWIVLDPFVSGVGTGLWQSCAYGSCQSYPSRPDYLKATQAFVIIGLLAGVGGLVLSVISLLKKQKIICMMAGVACFAAAGCILIAIIVFGAENTLITERTQYGWGFILCILSIFPFVPAGALNLLETKHTS
ncbi:hypothetical protein SNE40_022603 [Patella caerulea]|uniref:Uncharacterized protein n=1 Tax=Patella caerulea TaxID=87958 RepID=A0AAN8IZS3_PATCE